MASITEEAWRALPPRSELYAELAAEPVPGVDIAHLAVDHEGLRHLLLATDSDGDLVSDERSRGVRAITRPLAVQGQAEGYFIDVFCTSVAGHDVFELVVSAIIVRIEQGSDPAAAVRGVLERWRRFWGAAPDTGLTADELRGLFGELWFLSVWLGSHGDPQVAHWLGPTGSRHDFQWPGLAIEVKTTTSVRGHVHRISGLDQLQAPGGGRLLLFSLRLREEPTAANSVVTLIEAITDSLAAHPEALDGLEVRLAQAGYSPAQQEQYSETRFRVVNERLYEVVAGFPRLSPESFVGGVPDGVERVEYEVNLDGTSDLVVATSPDDFSPPPA